MTVPLLRFLLLFAQGIVSLIIWLGRRLWGSVLKSFLAVLFLLSLYAVAYWTYLLIARRHYVTIAPFRTWGDLQEKYPGEGVAARFGDELIKLQKEMHEFRSVEHPDAPILQAGFYSTRVELPAPAQVTVQYAGVSPEALNSFLRRLFRRERTIGGDMIPGEEGCMLVARSGHHGPWEVHVDQLDSSSFQYGLQELAARTVAGFEPDTTYAIGNALVARQRKASGDGQHDEAIRQAQIGLGILPSDATARTNLAVACNALGIDLGEKGHYEDAIKAFKEAVRVKSDFTPARDNLDLALKELDEGRSTEPRFDEVGNSTSPTGESRERNKLH